MELWRNQIVVDEATDFSPIQLGCMAALCDPSLNSFVACGDFNQRITSWGSRSNEDLKWVLPKADIRSIAVSYRHSRQLAELAHAIASLGGRDTAMALLPDDVDNDGVNPVLGLELSGEQRSNWLAARIVEIERLTGTLPSIAILVNRENEVVPVADGLRAALADQNIGVAACRDGKVVGQDQDVRVFDVQHIKGLEFEAAFFVDVDQLVEERAGLFDKYLYVGTTRAATYFGMTCSGKEMPKALAPLQHYFGTAWPGLR